MSVGLTRGIGVGLPVNVRDDRHVGRNVAVYRVQRGDHRLIFAIRPQRQVTQCAIGRDGRVEDIALRRAGDVAGAVHHIHRRIQDAIEAARSLAGINHAARHYRVQREAARPWSGEIAVDIAHQLGVLVGIG